MTVYKPILAALFVFSISQNSIADIYKCKNPDGTSVFQDKHCAEKTGEQIVSNPQSRLCYSITNLDGRTIDVQNFWTEKQNGNSLFYVEINKKKNAFVAEQIESIKVMETKNTCALAKLVSNAREIFDAAICDNIHYLTSQGEDYLVPAKLDSIKACQSKAYADGFWTLDQKKYLIQSAYVSYSKQSNQLKVLLFPFMLNQNEEGTVLNQQNIDSILSRKPDSYAFGIIFKLKENVTEPQISDVIQFQSLLINNKTTVVRSYDQKWQWAINIKKLHINNSKQGKTAQISWSLNNRNEQADVNVSAIMLEEN